MEKTPWFHFAPSLYVKVFRSLSTTKKRRRPSISRDIVSTAEVLEDRTLLSAAPVLDLNGPDQAGTGFTTSFTEDLGAVSVADSDLDISISGDTAFVADLTGNQIVSIDLANGDQQVISSGNLFNQPYDLDFGISGNLIVGNQNDTNLLGVNPVTGSQTIVEQNGLLTGTHSIAADSTGALFVGQQNGVIEVFPGGSHTPIVFSGRPFTGMDVDSNDHLYFVGNGSTLFRLDDSTGALTTINQLGSKFIDVAVAGNGTLYLTDDANDKIWRFDEGSTSPTLTGTFTEISSGGLLAGNLRHLDVDSNGDLIATVFDGGGRVVRVAAGTGQQTLIASGTSDLIGIPNGIVVSQGGGSGNLASATVTITNVLDGTDESLTANTFGTNIISSYNSATGILSLTGLDSASHYAQVLSTVTFDNASQDPDQTPRTIEFVVNDGNQNSNVAIATVDVVATNDAPLATIDSAAPTGGVLGQTISFAGTLNDPDSQDAHSLVWEVRDSLNQLVATGSGASFDYAPTELGTLTVTFSVNETNTADLFTDSDSVQVSIQQAALIDGTLSVGAGSENDKIDIKHDKKTGNVSVKVNKQQVGTFSALDLIVVYGGAGNDKIKIDHHISVPTLIFGGDGKDHIKGGDGDDTIFGGDGDDKIDGGKGNDLLIGGAGKDKMKGGEGRDVIIAGTGKDDLKGGKQDDLLIAGPTAFDSDLTSLDFILAEWTSARSYEDRIDNLLNGTGPLLAGTGTKLVTTGPGQTVFDDAEKDKLKGDQDRDAFFADLDGLDNDDDEIKDQKADETLELIFD